MNQISCRGNQRKPAAFALVTTLIILAVLTVAVVGFLASMIGERQTSDAYTSKTRAEDAAQTGVQSAMVILSQSFQSFPDSATVWDATQSPNSDGTSNEGTSLYLRAVPQSLGSITTANPNPTASSMANDPAGNGPNNPNRSTFVLPLVSGVPYGSAQLVSNKSSIMPKCNTAQTNPALQTYTDLNVRRFAGDLQGAIGSPPGWASASPVPTAPKPIRAPWVNIVDSSGNVSARYAFWVEDESFRANVNFAGNANQTTTSPRIDNTAQPTATPSGSPRCLLPGDMSLPGLLLALNDTNATTDASGVITSRAAYPNTFFPDPLAFQHAYASASGASALSGGLLDSLRYETSVQSGTLNLSRHGTQRVNLDALVPPPLSFPPTSFAPAAVGTIQTEIDQIAQTIGFHLPNFGQRFYRSTTDSSPTTLNDATQVQPSVPLASSDIIARTPSNAMTYLYKIATNIHDYIDSSTQPTLISSGGTTPAGTVIPQAMPSAPLGDDGSANAYWAQGKKNAPFIQEVAARYRPIIATSACPSVSPLFNYARGHYDLSVDYYVEFWNMTDRDVYAAPQTDPTLPHLNSAKLIIRDQQPWSIYPSGGGEFVPDPGNLSPPGSPGQPSPSAEVLEVDLSSNVSTFDALNNPVLLNGTNTYTTPDVRKLTPNGVVFPAGSVTVITTDPSCFLAKNASYPSDPNIQKLTGPYSYAAGGISPAPNPLVGINSQTTFLCQNLVAGGRHYAGSIQAPGGGIVSSGGVQLNFGTDALHFVAEVSLVNQYGYLDIARAALAQYGATPYTNTFKYIPTGSPWYNDWSYVSSLVGNARDKSMPFSIATPASLVSEVGDPRTNNEQLSISAATSLSSTGNADQSRFFASSGTLGYINNVTVRPDGLYGSYSATAPASSWPDYYTAGAQGTYVSPGVANAPAVIAGAPLTSIGQLGDVFDSARLPGSGSSIAYSRGGGRTFKMGQHDDRYDPTPPATDGVSYSNGWASWRLADIFSTDPLPVTQAEPIELPARININGVARDGGAALRTVLSNFNFQPATSTDPIIHGDAHAQTNAAFQSLAGQSLNLDSSVMAGLPEIVKAISARVTPPAGSATAPSPFFERGELSELSDSSSGTLQYIFGSNSFLGPGISPTASSAANNLLVSNPTVDMNSTFDHGREELFRRISELICTRGDTFTVYAVGQSLQTLPGVTPSPAPATPTPAPASPTFKITGTQRMRVTFRLVPMNADGSAFHPAYGANGNPTVPTLDLSSPTAIATRFAKPDHYDVQVLQSNIY